ncbi:MAG: (Fe-S)-binding protein, partial [Flavobacteriaceae bacterium]
TGAKIIATGCPFCNTMITDGVKNKEKEAEVKVYDLAELVAQASDL